MLSAAIQHYVLKGNLRRAATQQQHLAEVYEVELGDTKKALEAYEKAAEWFDGDNAEAYVTFPSYRYRRSVVLTSICVQAREQALLESCGSGCPRGRLLQGH